MVTPVSSCGRHIHLEVSQYLWKKWLWVATSGQWPAFSLKETSTEGNARLHRDTWSKTLSGRTTVLTHCTMQTYCHLAVRSRRKKQYLPASPGFVATASNSCLLKRNSERARIVAGCVQALMPRCWSSISEVAFQDTCFLYFFPFLKMNNQALFWLLEEAAQRCFWWYEGFFCYCTDLCFSQLCSSIHTLHRKMNTYFA